MNLEIYAFALNWRLTRNVDPPRKSLITTESAMSDQILSGITSSMDLWDVMDCSWVSIEDALQELLMFYNGFAYTPSQIKVAFEEFRKLVAHQPEDRLLREVLTAYENPIKR